MTHWRGLLRPPLAFSTQNWSMMPEDILKRLSEVYVPCLVIKLSHWLGQTSSARHLSECIGLDMPLPCLDPPQHSITRTLESNATCHCVGEHCCTFTRRRR